MLNANLLLLEWSSRYTPSTPPQTKHYTRFVTSTGVIRARYKRVLLYKEYTF